MATAFADDAFAAADLRTPKHLYGLRIEEGLGEQAIPWKAQIRKTPLFRAPAFTERGWHLSHNPLAHRVLLKYQFNASMAAHWKEHHTTYALRRATGNAVDSMILALPQLL